MLVGKFGKQLRDLEQLRFFRERDACRCLTSQVELQANPTERGRRPRHLPIA